MSVTTILQKHFIASCISTMRAILGVIAAKQPDHHKMIQVGYTDWIGRLLKLQSEDPDLKDKLELNGRMLHLLSEKLMKEKWIHEDIPELADDILNSFSRTYIAIEKPELESDGIVNTTKFGAEILITKLAKGLITPIHSHAPGYMHEEVLFGKLRQRKYILIDDKPHLVELHDYLPGDIFTNVFITDEDEHPFIHSLEALEATTTLAFLSEHPKNGVGNTYKDN